MKELRDAQENHISHAACANKNSNLKEMLKQTEGVIAAMRLDPLRGCESDTASEEEECLSD